MSVTAIFVNCVGGEGEEESDSDEDEEGESDDESEEEEVWHLLPKELRDKKPSLAPHGLSSKDYAGTHHVKGLQDAGYSNMQIIEIKGGMDPRGMVPEYRRKGPKPVSSISTML